MVRWLLRFAVLHLILLTPVWSGGGNNRGPRGAGRDHHRAPLPRAFGTHQGAHEPQVARLEVAVTCPDRSSGRHRSRDYGQEDWRQGGQHRRRDVPWGGTLLRQMRHALFTRRGTGRSRRNHDVAALLRRSPPALPRLLRHLESGAVGTRNLARAVCPDVKTNSMKEIRDLRDSLKAPEKAPACHANWP